jgi:cytidine deaminase
MPQMNEGDARRLIEQAKEAMRLSYAPASRFRVGAAILTKGGKVYLGANIEAPSITQVFCAERVALISALLSSEREFQAIAIVAEKGGLITPCGICRQLLFEFAPDILIIMEEEGHPRIMRLSELLPLPFDLKRSN